MTKHILTISRDEGALQRLSTYREPDEQDRKDYYSVSIECPTPEYCAGWEEAANALVRFMPHGPDDEYPEVAAALGLRSNLNNDKETNE